MWKIKIKLFCKSPMYEYLVKKSGKAVRRLEGRKMKELCCGVSQVSPASSRLPNLLPALFLFLTTSTSTSTTVGKSFFKHWTNPTQCRRWWRAQQISRSGIWKMGAVPCRALPAVCRVPVREKHCSALIRGSGASNWNDQIELHPIGLH